MITQCPSSSRHCMSGRWLDQLLMPDSECSTICWVPLHRVLKLSISCTCWYARSHSNDSLIINKMALPTLWAVALHRAGRLTIPHFPAAVPSCCGAALISMSERVKWWVYDYTVWHACMHACMWASCQRYCSPYKSHNICYVTYLYSMTKS